MESHGESQPLLDVDVVWWDGDHDPDHPYNWPRWRTISNCFLVSAVTFLTAFASSVVAPGVPQLMSEFGSESLELAGFVVSVYIFGFAAGPLVIAPLSELYGRVIVYHICNIGFVIFAAACALAPDIRSLIAFRFLSGIFGSCPATIGGGSIADMIPQEKRASMMAAYTAGALLAPIVGPIVGGIVAAGIGWRWDFWLLVISGGLLAVVMMLVLKETYHPVILKRKIARLRHETGNDRLRSKLDIGLSPSAYFVRNIIRPVKMLVYSPIVVVTCLSIAITYGYIYLLLTSFTKVFHDYYDFNTRSVGFCFFGLGIGSFIGIAIFSAVSDKMMRSKSANSDAKIMKPEYRLPPLPFAYICLIFGLLMYGWTAEARWHWVIPIIGTVFIGIGQLLSFMVLQLYLIDAFALYAASAVAAITATRSVAGALLPLFGLTMYDKFGIGWGNTLLAATCLPLLCVALLLTRYGEAWRTRFQIRDL